MARMSRANLPGSLLLARSPQLPALRRQLTAQRLASKALSQIKLDLATGSWQPLALLVPQGLDSIQLSGAGGRHCSEDDTNAGCNQDSDNRGHAGNGNSVLGKESH